MFPPLLLQLYVSRANKPRSDSNSFGINPDHITNGPVDECYDKNINDFYVYPLHRSMMPPQPFFSISTMDLQFTKLFFKF